LEHLPLLPHPRVVVAGLRGGRRIVPPDRHVAFGTGGEGKAEGGDDEKPHGSITGNARDCSQKPQSPIPFVTPASYCH